MKVNPGLVVEVHSISVTKLSYRLLYNSLSQCRLRKFLHTGNWHRSAPSSSLSS